MFNSKIIVLTKYLVITSEKIKMMLITIKFIKLYVWANKEIRNDIIVYNWQHGKKLLSI